MADDVRLYMFECDPLGHWGATTDVYYREMTAEQACVPALKNAGFDPADVKFILRSHLHLDHTGAVAALSDFPNAQLVATRVEYEYAQAPDWFAAGGYIQADEKGLPGFLASVVDTVRSDRKLHRSAARSDSTVVTGHDPEAWPKFKQAPEFYD